MGDGQRAVDVADPSHEFLLVDGLTLKEIACCPVSVAFDGGSDDGIVSLNPVLLGLLDLLGTGGVFLI